MSDYDLKTRIRYLIPGAEKPVYYASQGGGDAAMNIGAEFEDREVQVLDARALQPPATLDAQGFCLRSHEVGERDFYRAGDFLPLYEEEIKAMILGETGGSDALVFDHTLRSDSQEIRGERLTRETASVIHNDYTDASAGKRLRDLLPAEQAERRLQKRFAIVNLWRSIGGPVLTTPLACCDAKTIDPADLVAVERRAVERVGELELVTWNPHHRWYYYPAMTRDEVLLIKTFDSAMDGRARRSIHTAFDNPLAPPEAAPRESMESRLLVFFDEENP